MGIPTFSQESQVDVGFTNFPDWTISFSIPPGSFIIPPGSCIPSEPDPVSLSVKVSVEKGVINNDILTWGRGVINSDILTGV